MKRHLVHFLQKYLFNPPAKFLFAAGMAVPGRALLETTGCKSGKARCVPVGDGRVGQEFWLIAEHGRSAAYVRNVLANPRVRLRLNSGLRSHWHSGTAHVLDEDDPRERQ